MFFCFEERDGAAGREGGGVRRGEEVFARDVAVLSCFEPVSKICCVSLSFDFVD